MRAAAVAVGGRKAMADKGLQDAVPGGLGQAGHLRQIRDTLVVGGRQRLLDGVAPAPVMEEGYR